jgi:hypothetical protein
VRAFIDYDDIGFFLGGPNNASAGQSVAGSINVSERRVESTLCVKWPV